MGRGNTQERAVASAGHSPEDSRKELSRTLARPRAHVHAHVHVHRSIAALIHWKLGAVSSECCLEFCAQLKGVEARNQCRRLKPIYVPTEVVVKQKEKAKGRDGQPPGSCGKGEHLHYLRSSFRTPWTSESHRLAVLTGLSQYSGAPTMSLTVPDSSNPPNPIATPTQVQVRERCLCPVNDAITAVARVSNHMRTKRVSDHING